jgi:hypothetical protein
MREQRGGKHLCISLSGTLPVELLAHIFVLFSLRVPNNGFPYPAWLPIAHVCHYWRTVALSHAQLWTSITPGLSLPWIKVFMERSQTMLMELSFLVHRPAPVWSDTTRPRLLHKDIILLLKGFTRVRSLCLTGNASTIGPIMNILRHSLPVQSLSICIEYSNGGGKLILPDNLFGGKAPIRRLQFMARAHSRIVAPDWLLRDVTHFTSKMSATLYELLDGLHSMSQSAPTHFEYWQPLELSRELVGNLDLGHRPTTSPIQMPHLVNLIIRAREPDPFMLLHRLLLSHADAKWRLELYSSAPYQNSINKPFPYQIDYLSQIIEAANGFKHIQISGTQTEGWCRLWTGNALTTWEDAKFCFCCGWVGFRKENLYNFITACGTLGAARLGKLVIDSPQPGLPMSSWWKFLWSLRGIEELELHLASVDTLGAAWEVNLAPAVLQALRKVRIVDPSLASPQQYAIIRDRRTRKIMRLPSYANSEDDVASLPDLVPVEKELESMSRGLLRLLRGSGRKIRSG